MDVYTYELPPERIAQRPCYPADAAKLLVVDRSSGELKSVVFRQLTEFLTQPEFLTQKDLLILNNTKVIPARIFFNIGDAEGELLIVRKITGGLYECLGRPGKKLVDGASLTISAASASIQVRIYRAESILEHNGASLAQFFNASLPSDMQATGLPELLAECQKIDFKSGNFLACFTDESGALIDRSLAEIGVMPIPPYIRDGHGDQQDQRDYQTLFAEKEGSVAAPTASLHFTPELLAQVEQLCSVEKITLHVGPASFRPVVRGAELVPPGQEFLHVESAVMEKIAALKDAKATSTGASSRGRTIAVGTTVVRALESAARGDLEGATELFIQPGFEFKAVDALITNFHQPGTTHLLLVEALLGRDLLAKAYQFALDNGYRFLSYGDAMLIV